MKTRLLRIIRTADRVLNWAFPVYFVGCGGLVLVVYILTHVPAPTLRLLFNR